MSLVSDLLDDDILYEIFNAVAFLDPPKVRRFRPNYVRIHLGWICLSHICRRWRTILVHNMPRLWANLPCLIPSALDTVLERAHELPLALRTRVKFNSEKDTFKTCFNFSERLREISSALVNRAYLLEYEPFSNNPAGMGWYFALHKVGLPLLQELRISESRIDTTRPQDYARRVLHIDAPNLRIAALSIRGSLEFKHDSLTSLDVDSGCVELLREPSKGLLHVLATQTSLASFATSFQSLDIDWEDESMSPLPVHLAHLKDLRISSRKIPDLLSFFQCIDCPSIRHMRLSVGHSQYGDWQACVRLFERIACNGGVNTLNLHHSGNCHYTYALHHSPDDWDMTSPAAKEGPMAFFETSFNVRGIPDPSFPDFYWAFLNLSRTGTIRRLVFDETITTADYQELLHSSTSYDSLSAITSLWLNTHDGYSLLCPSSRKETDKPDTVLPSISELAVPHMCPPTANQAEADLQLQLVVSKVQWSQLAGALKKRAVMGHPIRRVVLLGTWESEDRRVASAEGDT